VRAISSRVLGKQRRSRRLCRVVIAGSGYIARELAAKIHRHPEMLCRVVGFLYEDQQTEDRLQGNFVTEGPMRTSTLGLIDLLSEQEVDELMLAFPSTPSAEVLRLALQCRERGISVSLIPQPYELYLSKPKLLDLDGLPILQFHPPNVTPAFERGKRVIDICFGSIFLLLAAPVVLASAIVLRVLKHRTFRWETRCGQFGRKFQILRLDVDRDPPPGSRFETLLAQLSISELPQLWNVLRGQMSLVGPRPESPTRTRRYTQWEEQRLRVKPGMTGLAQVHGLREQSSSEEKTRFDLQYVLHSSLTNDLSLLVQTVWTLALRVLRSPIWLTSRVSDSRSPTLTSADLPESPKLYSSDHRAQSGAD